MNYIEEVARRIWAESGRDDYELEELVTALQEVDRRAREEERKKMREEEDNYNENTLNA